MADDSTVTLCVLLWAVEGEGHALVDYEDKVLALVVELGGRVIERVRGREHPEEPFEVQVLEFPSERVLDEFMHDERRQELLPERDLAVARTEVIRVRRVL
jgi:uncharacterized protein (DUF1330 family)